MTDNEIIKALECCKRPVGTGACKDCPLDKDRPCTTTMIENALDLINRQKAEIDRLNLELQAMRGAANSYKAELEREQNLNVTIMSKAYALIKTAKAEAVKEFAEVIKKNHGALFNTIYSKHFGEIIDNLVEEMVGEG